MELLELEWPRREKSTFKEFRPFDSYAMWTVQKYVLKCVHDTNRIPDFEVSQIVESEVFEV